MFVLVALETALEVSCGCENNMRHTVTVVAAAQTRRQHAATRIHPPTVGISSAIGGRYLWLFLNTTHTGHRTTVRTARKNLDAWSILIAPSLRESRLKA